MANHLSSAKQALKSAFTGKRRSSLSILPMNNERFDSKNISSMTIPTSSGSAEEEEVDISKYTTEDLERLRLEDPFLYYSIPEMKRQLYDRDSVSPSNSLRNGVASNSSQRRASCPIFINTPANQHAQQRRESVTRVRRLSTEPHPSVIMQQVMNEMGLDEEFNDSDMDEEDEKLLEALKNGTFDA